jgi:hypothetical protein
MQFHDSDGRRRWRTAVKLGAVVGLGALALPGCAPDWATSSEAPVVLLMTSINGGAQLDSDLRISSGSICPDVVPLRLENHEKNPKVGTLDFRGDLTVERYEIHYFRSDGRATEGVDVPYSISGNLSQEVIADSTATLNLEVVRRQAKIEPPLSSLVGGGGPLIVTMFAEITLHARTTIGQTTNSVTGRLQIDFADFGDTLTACPVASQ